MKFAEILFPTDFSTASEAAGRVARTMAVESGARLHVLHAVPPVTDPTLPSETLAKVAKQLGADVRVQPALVHGVAGRSIVDYAREKGIDLIVLGTHGRTGISYAILGSVAEQVLRRAPCLVLMVPAARLAREVTVPAAVPPTAAEARPCLVCGYRSDDLICESCRARIRGEALQQKREAERPGRRGSPV